jgi:hypothetical protein
MSGFEEIPLIAAMIEGGGALGTAAGEGASTAALSSLGGMGGEQAAMLAAQNAGFGPSGLGMTLKAAAGAQPGLQGALSSGMGGLLGAGSKAAASPMAAQMGMGLLSPQQPPPMRGGGGMPQGGGGQQAPMPLPYGGATNSMNGPPPGMTLEEWLKRKQMMGGMQ